MCVYMCVMCLKYGVIILLRGKSNLTEVELWERYIVDKRADYDRLIIIC